MAQIRTFSNQITAPRKNTGLELSRRGLWVSQVRIVSARPILAKPIQNSTSRCSRCLFMTRFQGYHLMQQSPRRRLFERQVLEYL